MEKCSKAKINYRIELECKQSAISKQQRLKNILDILRHIILTN